MRSSLVNLDDFPATKEYVYLNAASISLMPLPVLRKMNDFQEELALRGTVWFDEEVETMAMEDARNEAAKLIGAGVDEIALLSSTTEALCAIAWSLDFKRGDNVVTTDMEFPSVIYPWMRIGKEKGVEVRLAKNKEGIVEVADLEKLMDDRTRVLAISHVEYASGLRFNLKELHQLTSKHGASLVVDAIQSLGVVPVNVKNEDVDILASGSYKWLLGPFGAAILYVKRDVYEELDPPFVGWRSTEEPFEFKPTQLRYAKTAKKFEYSTTDYASKTGLAEAIKYLQRIGIKRVYDHVLKLTGNLMQSLSNLRGVKVITPREDERRAGIVTIRFEEADYMEVAKKLGDRGIIVSPRFESVRFSPHVYNTEEDMSKTSEELKKIIS
ncbi:aminotransferase class V-fold PLP-dependent enzyme [Candidatus Bathyarchaeota archaeon]|nr:aminotransferase class V-fold PLP-dependent enzyme [Candidatus Bathyarchaeota archaeon]